MNEMKKKIAAIAAAAVFSLLLCSCGDYINQLIVETVTSSSAVSDVSETSRTEATTTTADTFSETEVTSTEITSEITPPPETAAPVVETIAQTTTAVVTTTPETTQTMPVVKPEATTPAVTSAPAEIAPVTTTPAVTTTAAESFVRTPRDKITTTYGYRNMSDKNRKIYEILVDALDKHLPNVVFDGIQITKAELGDVFSEIYYSGVGCQYLQLQYEYSLYDNYVYEIRISYAVDKETAKTYDSKLNAKIEEIVSKITPTMSDYDIVKYFHDYIIANTTYDTNAPNSANAYGALVEKRAVCQGYAIAFSKLCDRVGIENAIVTGDAGEPHMWNDVLLDGEWYAIDSTWDDNDRTDETAGLSQYNYFCVTDAELRKSRTYYKAIYTLPEAKGTKYNYFRMVGGYVNSFDEAKASILKQLEAQKDKKDKYVYLKYPDENTLTSVSSALLSDRDIAVRFSGAGYSMDKETSSIIYLIRT